ncbi:zinc finger BED domain-containing protein RICESLEEPER 2-like protein [Tanacetum coccineum]
MGFCMERLTVDHSTIFHQKYHSNKAAEAHIHGRNDEVNIFQADQCDAFDFDVDEAPTAQTMFMANLSSADPVYDEAGPSYDLDTLSEVQDHDNYLDNINEYHEEHEMQNDVQPNKVIDSDTEYTSNSNIISYEQYVQNNEAQVIQSDVSYVLNDALMMIINDIDEQPSQYVPTNKQNKVVNESLTRREQKNQFPKLNQVELLIELISTDLEFFDDTYATKAKKWFNDSLEGLYNIYYAKYGNPTNESSSGASSSKASGGNQMSKLLNRLQEHRKKKARNDPSLSSEYERYVNSDFVTLLDNSEFAAFDLLGFWKAKETMFPVLSRMAMDIISVQATSVASESAFSTSGRVLSIRRTRLTPASLEMCMCLKDHLDAQERIQHKSGLENPIDFEEEILDAEVQQNEAIPLSEEEIALDVASSEGTMSGSGSGGEEVDYDMTNYGYDDYE